MLRRILLTLVVLLVALPAYAWQLQTRVATVGGSMAVDGVEQTSVNGTVYKNYTNAVQPAVLITAASGYKIASVSINGAAVSPVPVSPANYTMGMVVYPTRTTQSVLAYFTKETYPLTTAAGTGGSVSPAGTSNVQFGLSKTVLFSPQAGKNVVAIDGLPAGTVLKNYATGAAVTLPAATDVKVSATFTMPASAVSLTGKFVYLTASTDGPKTVLAGRTGTLTATSEPAGATFAWTQTGGPGYPAAPITGTGATLSLPATLATGTYNFKVTATSGANTAVANTYAVVTTDVVDAATAQCNVCHLSRNLGQAELSNWSTSLHATNAFHKVMCYDCHTGAASGGHPGAVPTAATCTGCHAGPYMAHDGAFETSCLQCHDPHALAPSATAMTAAEEFFASFHWQNHFETGPEFEHQLDVTIEGGTVTHLGTYTDGYLNANDSYETLENGGLVTCAYRCHFRPGSYPSTVTPPAAYFNTATGRATTYLSYTAPDGTVYSRPGGDACAACHEGEFANANARSTCYTCHTGKLTSHGWVTAQFEASTHNTGEHAKLYYQMDQKACLACHDPHSTEATFGDATGTGCQACHRAGTPYGIYAADASMVTPHGGGAATVQAQYMFAGQTCANCHINHDNNYNIEYAESGHGDVSGEAWMHYDWLSASRLVCARCHTTTGYLSDLTDGVQPPATPELAGQVLACNACHVDSGKKINGLRTAGAYTLTTGTNAATQAFPNVAASNLCVRCHAGRETGGSLLNDPDADGNRSFINSHYLAAAQTVFARGGYEYAGQSYSFGFHQQVGVGNVFNTGSNGPCVSCHMSAGATGHSWEVVAKDGTGAMTAITSTACANCHQLTPAALETAKHEFHLALDGLKAALEAKGIYFYPAHPYFYTAPYVVGGTNTGFTNWAGVYGLDKWKDVMGAAFNYNLLEHEPGAFAHNRDYAVKLIVDSIDFLNDGAVDGDSAIPFGARGEFEHAASINPGDGSVDPATCTKCHVSGQAVPTAGAKLDAHASTGQVAVSNVVVTEGDPTTITFNVKVDGLNKDNFTFNPSVYRYAASTTTPGTYPIVNDFTRTSIAAAGYTVVSNGNGNYTVAITGAAPAGNNTYMVTLRNAAAAPQLLATAVGHGAAPARNVASSQGCVDCHGDYAFKSGSHHSANPQGVEACVVCHTRASSVSRGAGGDRTTAYVHGIHNSHSMPAGGYDRQFPTKDGVIDFSVTYPTYMLNCEVCHKGGQLASVVSEPVQYYLCMSCHDTWEGFGHALDGVESHTSFNWNTDCSSCHAGDTVATMHNGLFTERSGLVWNGQDVSVIEGAKVDMQITGTSRSGNNLLVTWTATYDGTPVNPCNTAAAVGAPIFHRATANDTIGQAASNLSIIRGFAQGDDWVNAGIGTSPGQPLSTNLSATNTTCAGNVATTTIALGATEIASAATRGIVALQGKAQVMLPYAYDGGTKTVIQVRSKTPTREFVVADGSTPLTARREIVDTASCLKCHPGSLYQHGGNRIDNVDMCVVCHNEASSEQNVRLLDGVSASEAYDQKPGQTYGFKSFLHAVHSAGENEAVTMCYRTNGNYVWAGHDSVIPNYPEVDYLGNPMHSGGLAVIAGSSAPHGTGSVVENIGGVDYKQVYRVHNLHPTTYPQALNNCMACHKPGTYGLPDPSKAVGTTMDAGTVGLGGTIPNQTASNVINSNLLDDTLRGPAAAACFSCHQGEMSAPAGHEATGGFTPAVFPGGRADLIDGAVKENCVMCHQ